MLNEMNQTEKDKYHMCLSYMWDQKKTPQKRSSQTQGTENDWWLLKEEEWEGRNRQKIFFKKITIVYYLTSGQHLDNQNNLTQSIDIFQIIFQLQTILGYAKDT